MIKVVVACIIAGILILYLKNINQEMALLASIVAGILIIIYALNYFCQILDFFNSVIDKSGINRSIFKIIFKITTIGYLVEFGAGILSDFNLSNLADKLVFLGKVLVLSSSLPILYAIFNLISGFL